MTPMEEKFDLFLTFLSDIYYYNNVKDIITNFPNVYRELLNDIDINTNIYQLIRKNNIKQTQRIEEEKQIRKTRQKKRIFFEIKEITDEVIEKDILKEHKKNFKSNFSHNPLSLGQYTFNTIQLFYNPKNEIESIYEIIKKKMNEIILDCCTNIINLEYMKKNPKSDNRKYVLYNPIKIKKNKKPIINKLLRIKNPMDEFFFQNSTLYNNNYNNKNKRWLEIIDSYRPINIITVNDKIENKPLTSRNFPKIKSHTENNSLNHPEYNFYKISDLNSKNNITNDLNSKNNIVEKNNEKSNIDNSNLVTIKPIIQKENDLHNHKKFITSILKNNKSKNIIKIDNWLKNRKKIVIKINYNKIKIKKNLTNPNSYEIINNNNNFFKEKKLKYDYNYGPLLKLRSKYSSYYT